MNQDSIACAQYLREIARGKDNPRDLSEADAQTLWAGMLSGRVSDLEMGAVLIAMRVKGESVAEIAGFLNASAEHDLRLRRPPGKPAPVVIPSYNGARNMPNLTPLLAILLARRGVPVLVHGKVSDSDVARNVNPVVRTTSAEIFDAMGFHAARSADEVALQLARGEPAFLPVQILNPALARMLALRRILGVRNSAHSLVKMLQPFDGPALRLASYTHPEYHTMLSRYYLEHADAGRGEVLLARGTEGEVVANARKAAPIEWFRNGQVSTVAEGQVGSLASLPNLPEGRDAASTAVWIQAALSGERPVPESIERQVEAILEVVQGMR